MNRENAKIEQNGAVNDRNLSKFRERLTEIAQIIGLMEVPSFTSDRSCPIASSGALSIARRG